MTPQEMRALLDRKPFQPFRIHVDDGTTYDITNPRRTLVTGVRLCIGIPVPDDPNSDIADHFERVDWEFITKIEPLNSAAQA